MKGEIWNPFFSALGPRKPLRVFWDASMLYRNRGTTLDWWHALGGEGGRVLVVELDESGDARR